MSVLYIVVPVAFLIAGGMVLAFVWSVKSGQYDDIDTPARRVALDDDDQPAGLPAKHPQADAMSAKSSSQSDCSPTI
jgi:cbb3-type cytochrome oxidase maturation protein